MKTSKKQLVSEIVRLLRNEPKVILVWAINYDFQRKRRNIVIGKQPRIPDIVGMMRDGRFLAIEVRHTKKQPVEAYGGDVAAFFGMVVGKGYSLTAYSTQDFLDWLRSLPVLTSCHICQ